MIPRDWTPVASTNLSEVMHDGEDLHVKFRNGNYYIYRGVPEDVAVDLVHASSPGKHFHNQIKDNYATERIA